MSRTLATLLAIGLVGLAAVPAATGKGNVRAKIESSVRCDAAPGTTIRIAWMLSSVEGGKRHLFGASGIFVRLVSDSGAPAVKRHGKARRTGHYVARVKVPRGGIRRIEIGLEGTRHIGDRVEDADRSFPVDNDPCRRG